MFTVLSNTRNSSLYLISALAIMGVLISMLAFAPTIMASRTVSVPALSLSEARSDYHQRHPGLRISTPILADPAADFFLRHPGWRIAPILVNTVGSDFFKRHPEWAVPAAITADLSDYYFRLQGQAAGRQADLSDYYLRHVK